MIELRTNNELTVNLATLVKKHCMWMVHAFKMTITKQLKEFFSVLLLLCAFLLVNGDFTIGNLEVDSPEDGTPSLDTGLYLMSQEAPFDGYIKSVNACAFLVDSNPNPQVTDEITLLFFAAGYRLMGNIFRRITDTLEFTISIPEEETLGCNIINLADRQQPMMLKGDRPGVFILQEECLQFSLLPPTYICSAHVNLVDPIMNCSQSLYFNNTSLEGRNIMPAELTAINGHPVDVFINLDIVIEPSSPQLQDSEGLLEQTRICATKLNFNETKTSVRTIVIGLSLAAGGLGLIGGVILIVVVLFVYYRRQKEKLKQKEEADDADMESDSDTQQRYKSRYHQANNNLSNSQVASFRRTPSIPNDYSMTSSNASSHRLQIIVSHDTQHYEDASSMDNIDEELEAEYEYADVEDYWEPANKETRLKEQIGSLNIEEIPFDDLEIKEKLGSGQFATVHRGVWRNPEDTSTFKEVAVKCLKEGACEEERICFLREAAIMGQFEHPNILQILAIAYNEVMEPILVVDLMHIGDLRHHLQSLRPENCSQTPNELSPTLLSYSRQIAFGMLYLSCKKFIHRDLAARNVLVANDGTCKIADFGLSRDLHYQDYYISQGGKVPVKWTAPEALHYRKYSTASDVWSYGCLLYEIWSLGCKPFSTSNNIEVTKQIASGYRLPPPPGCPRTIYDTMMKCWNPKPELRPPFLRIVVALQQPDFKILNWSTKDRRSQSDAMYLGAPLAEGESLFKSLQCIYTIQKDQVEPNISRSAELLNEEQQNQGAHVRLLRATK